jgi:choline dehydrogenase
MREAVKASIRFVGAPAWSDYVIGRFGTGFSMATDDASMDVYIRGLKMMTTIFPPVGTSSVSPSTASSGVVNPNLRSRVLVVSDASIFKFVVS